jgi:hypothetical protein
MTRVLSSACVVLLMLCLGGRAWAGGIDPETTRAAKDLTTALRDRAKAGTGPYAPVQGGEKELIDEKLLNNCDTEANTCMAAIGTELGADVLMYGRIWLEKSAQTGQSTYKVSLKLLNVGRKQLASSTVETLALSESTGVRVSAHAKAWYGKLVGAVSGGTLAIRANIDRGTVLLDDDARGNLASGTLTLSGIPEGRHTLAIEAKDYQRYEAPVTIRTGETTTQNVTLVDLAKKLTPPSIEPISREGTVTAKSRTNYWKPVFYGTLLLDAAAAGFSLYEWKLSRDDAKKIMRTPPVDQSSCGTSLEDVNRDLKSACSHYQKRTIGWVVTGVLGAAVVGSFVMAYVRDHGDSERAKTASRGHRKRRELVVTPVITADGGGATLQFDW